MSTIQTFAKKIISTLILLVISAHGVAEEPASHFFTTSDGVKIHYLTIGNQGSFVMLIHGFTSSARRNWFDHGIPQHLSKNHRIIALDTRNHGESEVVKPVNPGNSLEVRELIEHLGISRLHIHGYSMGAGIAKDLLKEIPERFTTVSLGGGGILEETAGGNNLGFDLPNLNLPVMAINGSENTPFTKTVRMTRELKDFTNYILPGSNHMNAMYSGTGYAERLANFININDEE